MSPFLCVSSVTKNIQNSLADSNNKKRNYKKGSMKEKAPLLMGQPHQC